MKWFLVLGATLIGGNCLAADRWTEIMLARADMPIYIDELSVERSGSMASAWFKYENFRADPGEDPRTLKVKVTFQCKQKRSRTDAMIVLDQGGKVVVQSDKKGEFAEISPESTGEVQWVNACERALKLSR